MKEITLTKGAQAIVDDEDYEWLNQWRWQVDNQGYAKRIISVDGGRQAVFMHRLILGLKYGDKLLADHINHNSLDNRRCNLRIVNNSQNQANSYAASKNLIGYKGVRYHPLYPGHCKAWRAEIRVNRKGIYIGSYETAGEAALAYNKAAIEYFGEYACLNALP